MTAFWFCLTRLMWGLRQQHYFDAEPETMFVIGLTPNRIDSASHYGVARDLAAYLKKDRDITVIKPSS